MSLGHVLLNLGMTYFTLAWPTWFWPDSLHFDLTHLILAWLIWFGLANLILLWPTFLWPDLFWGSTRNYCFLVEVREKDV